MVGKPELKLTVDLDRLEPLLKEIRDAVDSENNAFYEALRRAKVVYEGKAFAREVIDYIRAEAESIKERISRERVMGDLKPCPFCSNKAEVEFLRDMVKIKCVECCACVWDYLLDDAKELWNNRPIEESLNKQIAEFKELVEHLSRMSCHCQVSALDVKINKHCESCSVGKAQKALSNVVV